MISDELAEPGQQYLHLQGPADTAAVSSAKFSPVDAMAGDGAEVQEKEGEDRSEVEKFITLAELAANRLSDAGMHYIVHTTYFSYAWGGGLHNYSNLAYHDCCRNERRAHIQKLLTRGAICTTLPEECGKASR